MSKLLHAWVTEYQLSNGYDAMSSTEREWEIELAIGKMRELANGWCLQRHGICRREFPKLGSCNRLFSETRNRVRERSMTVHSMHSRWTPTDRAAPRPLEGSSSRANNRLPEEESMDQREELTRSAVRLGSWWLANPQIMRAWSLFTHLDPAVFNLKHGPSWPSGWTTTIQPCTRRLMVRSCGIGRLAIESTTINGKHSKLTSLGCLAQIMLSQHRSIFDGLKCLVAGGDRLETWPRSRPWRALSQKWSASCHGSPAPGCGSQRCQELEVYLLQETCWRNSHLQMQRRWVGD